MASNQTHQSPEHVEELSPGTSPYFPTGHGGHSVSCPYTLVYRPAGHGVQAACPAESAYCPGAHGVITMEPTGQ
jgi:hypothetical protein